MELAQNLSVFLTGKMNGNLNKIQTRVWLISTLILCFAFIGFKIPFLTEPCNGDEAYPYSVAIDYMVNHNLSISPSAIPVTLSKGHPVLYHFLQAGWIKLFGKEMWVARLFPLLLSVLILLRVYLFGKRFFSPAVGFFSALLLASRSIFFVQASFMLPETLLTLLLLLTIQFYLEKKWFYYCLSGSLLVLTKEPALIFIGIFGLFEFTQNIKTKLPFAAFVKNLLLTGFPIITALAFYIWQKNEMGWYFYPEHLGYISFSLKNFFDKLFILYGSSIFIFYGGVFTLSVMILLFLLNIIKKNNRRFENIRAEFILLLLTLSYLIFSSLNFASPRYALCLYPLIFLLVINQVFVFFKQNEKWARIISVCLAGISIGYLIDVRSNGDLDLRSADATKVRADVINYCKAQGWREKKIYAPFFMEAYMTYSSAGYLKPGEDFKNITNSSASSADIYIFPTDENYPTEKDVRSLNLKLIARFGKNNYNIEIKSR